MFYYIKRTTNLLIHYMYILLNVEYFTKNNILYISEIQLLKNI